MLILRVPKTDGYCCPIHLGSNKLNLMTENLEIYFQF
jgi:hypothetical protein